MTSVPSFPPLSPAPAAPSKVGGILKRAWKGFLTAATSSAAIKSEKNLTVTIITGVLLSVGASAGLVDLVSQLIQGA